jgi:phytoene dehydrogenase-like protein
VTANEYLVGIHWHDAIVVGAGHNGLTCALMLAKRGLKVLVLEASDVLGGATRTERPFAKAPDLAISTGAYEVGLLPAQLASKLGLDLPLVRREPRQVFVAEGSDRVLAWPLREDHVDYAAATAMLAELAALRDDVERAWLEEPLSVEETAERYVRRYLRHVFVDLCRKPAADYLRRWGFHDELVVASRALSALAGVTGTWSTPGTGMALLVDAMARDWSAVRGGAGTLVHALADLAQKHGAVIHTEERVTSIVVEGGVVKGVVTKDGTMHHAGVVVCNVDPFRMHDLVGSGKWPPDFDRRLDALRREGTTMAACLALSAAPALAAGGADEARAATMHLVPLADGSPLLALERAWGAVQRGALPDAPAIACVVHTIVDPTLRDPEGRHACTLFAQVPYSIAGDTWEGAAPAFVDRLVGIVDRFAPGFAASVVDTLPLHPQALEARFGMTRGHPHHVDNAIGFADRAPYATPVPGLYSCSAGTHPAGGVIGAAGHNAAMRVLRDLGKRTSIAPPA